MIHDCVYELRLYTVVPGRISIAVDRFVNHLPALFAQHAICNLGRWTASAGPDGPMFIYMMRYRSLAEREEVWAEFWADPAWAELRARTQGDEEATERFAIHFLRKSAIWTPGDISDAIRGGVHDLIFAEMALGKPSQANAYLRDVYVPRLEAAGATTMLVADFLSGAALPRTALMFGWPDAHTRRRGWQGLLDDSDLADAIATERRTLGRATLGRTETYLLEPTGGLLPHRRFA